MSKIYIRDGKFVKSTLVEDKGIVYCTEKTTIHMPFRFIERNLGTIGTDTTCYGILPIIHESTGKYAVMSVNAIVHLYPLTTDTVKVNDTEYYQFFFEENTPIYNVNVVRTEQLMFNVIDEMILKAKVPWYFGYEDLTKLLDTAQSHANSRVGENLEIVELLTSLVGRYKKNLKNYIRYETDKAAIESSIDYVPLSSVLYNTTGTANKLIGAYLEEGLASALVTENKETSRIEKLLRT